MEHKIEKSVRKTNVGISKSATALDGAAKGTSVAKKAGGAAVKTGGKIVSAVSSAADKVVDSVDNDVVQLANKSMHVASQTVKLGGKVVKTTGKLTFKSIKLSSAVVRKIRDRKRTLKVKTSKLHKLEKAAAVGGKTVMTAAKAAKKGVRMTGSAVDKASEVLEKTDNDAALFAKKAYDVARTGGAITYKVGKTVGKATYRTGKTLFTKKGRRKLVKSVQRKVNTAKRTVHNVRKVAKTAVKAAKYVAKLAAKAAKLAVKAVVKLVKLFISLLPWSGIVVGVVVLLMIVPQVIVAVVSEEEEKAQAGIAGANGTTAEMYENLEQFEEFFSEVAEEQVVDPLKDLVEKFCGASATEESDTSDSEETSEDEDSETTSDSDTSDEETSDDESEESESADILRFNGAVYYPASGYADTVNKLIADYVSSSTSRERFVTFLSVMKVLEEKGTGKQSDTFTKDDFTLLFGGLNENECKYGDNTFPTFFIKTSATSNNGTCPQENCQTEYRDGCSCGGYEEVEDEDTGETTEVPVCDGHPYCTHDHTVLTITLKTVEESYSDKSIAEIYDFNSDDEYRFNMFMDYIDQLISEMEQEKAKEDTSYVFDPTYTPDTSDSDESDAGTYVPNDKFSVYATDMMLIAVLVVSMIFLGLRKKRGG